MKKRYLLFYLAMLCLFNSYGQQTIIKGKTRDSATQLPLEGVIVKLDGTNDQCFTDSHGDFILQTSAVDGHLLTVRIEGYDQFEQELVLRGGVVQLGQIQMISSTASIPTITLSNAELAAEDNQDISGLLTASSDIFARIIRFPFFASRFNIKGLPSANTAFYLNGIPLNSLENGWVQWHTWSGLNDVTRYQYSNTGIGLSAMPFAFGGAGGASYINISAASQRRQTRVSYAHSNRTYQHRIMLTHNTGQLSSGWAFSFSGSRRWAGEGYVPGTFYDGWSYFLGVEKSIEKDHRLTFNVLGTPTTKGKAGAATREMYELAGTNYYNPYWGYQSGQKRNSRVSNQHQPLFILGHDWNLGRGSSLKTSASFRTGRNGSTALDWYNARDPRPDYYRRLPSFIENEANRELVADALRKNEALRQIDWDYFYEVNRNSHFTVQDVDGVAGKAVTGRLSRYILEERRYDSREMNINTVYENIIGEHLTVQGGLNYRRYAGHNYKLVNDLLGGEFYLDVDKFAERDFPQDLDAQQSDLDHPNRLVGEGDIFGYNYEVNVHRAEAWLQSIFNFRRIDVFLAGNFSHSQFWRTGKMRNGKFPSSSLGNSEKPDFFNYGLKTGVTYKLNGRNYLYLHGLAMNRAPFVRNSFVSPRTRNQLLPRLDSEELLAAEAGYNIRSPYFKGRLGVYYLVIDDQSYSRSFYHDEERSFVNYIVTGKDSRHLGLEAAFDARLGAAWSVNGAAAIGEYIINSRPSAVIAQDNNATLLVEDRTLYLQRFYEPGVPQKAFTLGLKYNSPRFWFASLNANYFCNSWLDFNPDRRTAQAVSDVEPGSQLWQDILWQEELPAAFTLDFFGGGSIKLNNFFPGLEQQYFISFTLGINNLLNNLKFITGGFEQLRFDYENKDISRFPAKYYHGYGTNFFANIALRWY